MKPTADQAPTPAITPGKRRRNRHRRRNNAGATDRQRQWRARRRDGRVVVLIEVGPDLIDLLSRAHLLKPWDEKDRRKIAEALREALRKFFDTVDA